MQPTFVAGFVAVEKLCIGHLSHSFFPVVMLTPPDFEEQGNARQWPSLAAEEQVDTDTCLLRRGELHSGFFEDA
ncbi:hypothetical protein D3C87_1846410 [compost metagenome]